MTTKLEHYVAINHQKPFDENGDEALLRLDKSKPIISSSPLKFKEIFAQNHIYEHDDIPRNELEDGVIGDIEKAFWPIRDTILRGNVEALGAKQKKAIVNYIVLQDLRSRTNMLQMLEQTHAFYDFMSSIGDRYRSIVPPTKDAMSRSAKFEILNNFREIETLAKYLETHIMRIAIAPKGRSFVASDKILLKSNPFFKHKHELNGYSCVGVEFFLPISHNMGVWLICSKAVNMLKKSNRKTAATFRDVDPILRVRAYFNSPKSWVYCSIKKGLFENMVNNTIGRKLYVNVYPEKLEFWNYRQLFHCERWIASDRVNELELLKEFCERHPEIRKRPRVEPTRSILNSVIPKILSEAEDYCISQGVDIGPNGELLNDLKQEIYQKFLLKPLHDIGESFQEGLDEEYSIPRR